MALVPKGFAAFSGCLSLVALVSAERYCFVLIKNLATRLAVEVHFDLAVAACDEVLVCGAVKFIIRFLLLFGQRFLCGDEILELVTNFLEFRRDVLVRGSSDCTVAWCVSPLQVAPGVTTHILLVGHHFVLGAHTKTLVRTNSKRLVESLAALTCVQIPLTGWGNVASEAGGKNISLLLDHPLKT